MKKILGITGLLVFVCVFTAIMNPQFMNAYNIQNTIRWTALYGILSIGVAFVIITGGIDLSIGSTVGLVGSLLALALTHWHWNAAAALCLVLVVSLAIGLSHGLLITKMKLQPFVTTLCGLLVPRDFERSRTICSSIEPYFLPGSNITAYRTRGNLGRADRGVTRLGSATLARLVMMAAKKREAPATPWRNTQVRRASAKRARRSARSA